MRALLFSAAVIALPGCGLTLDYDPPTDGGMDAPFDGSTSDGGTGPECQTEVDCDDGDACNGRERCEEGSCVDGTDPVICPDEDLCDGVSTCDPSSGDCVGGSPPTCPPDDGNPCNGVEQCLPGLGCTAIDALVCNDGIDCTVDTCTPGGCTFTPDDTLCTDRTGGVCSGMGCTYGCAGDGDCVSGDACRVNGTCERGWCTFERMSCPSGSECCAGVCEPMGCDDGEHCTEDVCDRAVGCAHRPRLDVCDDGDACTIGDHCELGACVSTGSRACATSLPCHAGVCNDLTGDCDMVPVSDSPCLDDDPCTVGDVCRDGVCTPGTGRPTCFDGNPCTSDVCMAPGGCDNPPLPDGTTCSTFTSTGVCMGGTCTLRPLCPLGRADCDLDDTCECVGRCVPGAGGVLTCSTVADCTSPGGGCGIDQLCCTVAGAEFGTCYPEACLGCCTFSAG